MLTGALLFSVVVLLGAVAWLAFSSRAARSGARQESVQTEGQIEALNRSLDERMHHLAAGLNQQLSSFQQTLDTRLEANTKRLDERLEGAARTNADIQRGLEQVRQSSQKILEVGKEVASLQEILTAPKLRGGLGEHMLGELLGQRLPKDTYVLQHRFKSGEIVDALITLGGGKISVDAKFPLENFRKMISAPTEDEKKGFRRQFYGDVKKHIDAISKKYICPDEGTLGWAFMYIPAENVYYETIIKDEDDQELLSYFVKSNVIPVSPNSFYAYLSTVLLGLQGAQIEKRAKEIIGQLGKLAQAQRRFDDEFELLGKHLGNAAKKYGEAERQLGKVTDQLEHARSGLSSGETVSDEGGTLPSPETLV